MFRRTSVVVLLAIVETGRQAVAQEVNQLSLPRLAAYQVEFAVPDAPAFLLVSVDSSTILRPQTVRELGLSFTGFQAPSGSISLPRAFAVEFSPALLATSARLTSTSYNDKKLLYNTRISVAVKRASSTGSATRLGFGLRFTLANEADFRTDSGYGQHLQVTDLTAQMVAIYREARMRDSGETSQLVLTLEEQKLVDAIKREIADRWATRYWNADILDLAIGIGTETADSTGRDPRLRVINVWGTYAKGLGQWGQLLLGARFGSARDSLGAAYRKAGGLAIRIFAGGNQAKAFAEVQQTWTKHSRSVWLFAGGLEVSLARGVWAAFSTGVQQATGGTGYHTVTSFKVKTGL